MVRWTSAVYGGAAPLATVNDQTLLPGRRLSLFGPLSSRSWSVMLAAKSVTVQTSPGLKLTFGVITQVAPPSVLATVASLCVPLGQLMLNHCPATLTGSLKLMVMLASRGAVEALLAGSVVTTNGPISTIGAVRRGFCTPVTKSAPLTSVSVWPLFLRKMAVVLLPPGALVLPSLQFAVVP